MSVIVYLFLVQKNTGQREAPRAVRAPRRPVEESVERAPDRHSAAT